MIARLLARLLAPLVPLAPLLLAAPPATAQCSEPDAYEENDTCATAAVIPLDVTLHLTLEGQGTPVVSDPDFFRVTVPAGETLEVFAGGFIPVIGVFRIWGDVACTQLLASDTSGNSVLRVLNASANAEDFWIEVDRDPNGPDFSCEDYDLRAIAFVDPCPTLQEDAFEPNESPAQAAPLLPGNHVATLFSGTYDYYRIPAGHGDLVRLTASYDFTPPVGTAPTLVFYDVTDDSLIGGAYRNGVTELVNLTGANELGLYAFQGGNAAHCNRYHLQVEVLPQACGQVAPDPMEDNDSCAQALTLAPGDHTGLNIDNGDLDYFRIDVPPGSALIADTTYPAPGPLSGVRMWVWTGCDTGVIAHKILAEPMRSRTLVHNDTAAPLPITLQLDIDSQQLVPEAPCAIYDLNVELQSASLGTGYCPALPNSTGQTGKLEVYGSLDLDDDGLYFHVRDLPGWKPGIFFYGPTQVQVPFGEGLRCVGGGVTRTAPVMFTTTSGQGFYAVDPEAEPFASDFLPGSSWNVQFWHRDGGSAFNVTEAASFTLL